MKRLAVAFITIIIVGAFGQVQAQQSINETKKEVKLEKKTERKALRKLTGQYVSEISKASFYKDFGNLEKVVWMRSQYYDEATFLKDGRDMIAYYDNDGKLVGTTSAVAFEDIPMVAQKNIQKMYKDATVGKVIFFDDNELNDTDMMLYNIQFDDEDTYFVELTQGGKTFIVNCDTKGNVAFFKQL